MKRPRLTVIAVACLAAALSAATLYGLVYRPWALNWGATDEEIRRPMPGDEMLFDPPFNATRAVTIDAPPEDVWPWIVQIGYRRAGFYSYDRLDNDGIPSADSIMPEYQGLQVGHRIPMSENAFAGVRILEPPHFMVLEFETTGTWANSSWAWGLYAQGTGQTRLVTRLRVRTPHFASQFLLDALEIVMMRKCLLGIKQRVERAVSPSS
jgi:uncharacterized protein YndB with AHSA1/START domain